MSYNDDVLKAHTYQLSRNNALTYLNGKFQAGKISVETYDQCLEFIADRRGDLALDMVASRIRTSEQDQQRRSK